MVESFLDGRLSSADRQSLVEHVKKCKVCHEELEIYHVIYSVMDELDNEPDKETSNYMASLERKLGTNGKSEKGFLGAGAAFGLFLLGLVAVTAGLLILIL